MKFKIHSDINDRPDCNSLIGKDYTSAKELICYYWDNPSIKTSKGRNGYSYYEYYKDMDRIILFVDANETVLDVFCHKLVDWD